MKEGGRQGGIPSKMTWSKKKIKRITQNNEKYEAQKLNDRIRKKKAVIEATSLTPATRTSSSECSYSSRPSLGKAVACTIRTLPKTPG